MGKKAPKASRKYAASGQLKKEIQARKKHQQVKRNIERRKGNGRAKGDAGEKNGGIRSRTKAEEDSDEEHEEQSDEETGRFKGMNVDDFLKGDFMDEDSEVRFVYRSLPIA